MKALQTAFGRVTRLWAAQDTRSRWLIAASLLLLVVAHMPSLQFDYAAPDQWRAFRYSADERTPAFRWNACVTAVAELYSLSGRPLLWPTECLEHAVAGKVTDLWLLRPLVLSIVLLTVLYLGAVVAPLVGGWPTGVMAASLFVMSPGYSFMYLQGMTAGMVLLSVILAVASFSTMRRVLDERAAGERIAARKAAVPFLLFIAGCLIYPAWTFLVLPLALIEFGISDGRTLGERVRRLSYYGLFYLVAAISYYGLAKAVGYAWLTADSLSGYTGLPPDLGDHALSMHLIPGVLAARVVRAARLFYAMAPFSYVTPRGLPALILLLFSLVVGFRYKRTGVLGWASRLLVSVITFAIGSVVLLGAMSPWLFTKVISIAYYWMVPWYLFVSVALVAVIVSITGWLGATRRWLAPVILILGVAPVAAMQLKVDVLQVVISNYEMWNLGQRLDQWIAQKGYRDQRYLLFVLPAYLESTNIEGDLQGSANAGENALLLNDGSYAYIPMMIDAWLRQRPEVAKSVNLVFCGFNQDCVRWALRNGGANDVVVEMTDGKSLVRVIQAPFVINLSTLTSLVRYPAIERDPRSLPRITASSHLESLDAQGLMLLEQPGWHAASPVDYPQSITVDLQHPRDIQRLGFLPQDGLPTRAPKSLRIEVSDDGKAWRPYWSGDLDCSDKSEWHYVAGPPISAQYLRINIDANCGNPRFLTLRGLDVQ